MMDDFSKEEMAQLLSMFRHQSLEILDEMNQDLLALESAGLDDEVIRRLRRSAHTIKGDSACVNLIGVTAVAHKIEDLIDEVVTGERPFQAEIVDSILEGLDAMRAAIGDEEVHDLSSEQVDGICRALSLSQPSGTDEVIELLVTDEDGTLKSADPDERQAAAKPQRKQDFVRVEAATIDALMNLAGEMIVARSMMNQVSAEIDHVLARNETLTHFHSANTQIGKLISELQKSVLKMRMVSISQVFKRFSRPMRELAAEYGKQVEVTTKGEETELDRTLVDLLYEPLLHLLRNAVDHGIETPLEREAAGKPATGSIRLAAFHEGNQVVIEIADDGRGIDIEELKKKAVETGQLSETEAANLSQDEAVKLIFLSGLSTAKELTWVSGRGVGAAAVKTAIEQLRGTITVKSEPGVGTTFSLRMPLTLAIIRALLFTAGGRLYALPLLAIIEIAKALPDDITYLDGLESFRLRDRFISLIRPAAVLGYDRRRGGVGMALRKETGEHFVIIIRVSGRRYGIVAESLLGEHELVIKPLEGEWLKSEALAGATLLGDGRVALILDAGVVVRKAIQYERSRGAGIGVYAG